MAFLKQDEQPAPVEAWPGPVWEYRFLDTTQWKKPADAEAMFNELGGMGWELVAMSIYGSQANRAGAVFKRQRLT